MRTVYGQFSRKPGLEVFFLLPSWFSFFICFGSGQMKIGSVLHMPCSYATVLCHVIAFDHLTFSGLAKRLDGKYISELTYFLSSRT